MSEASQELRDKLRMKINQSKLSRSSKEVRTTKIDKVKTDLNKILEPTGINAEQFIQSFIKSGGLKQK